MLPDMNGLACLKAMTSQAGDRNSMPLAVMVTALNDSEMKRQTLGAGASDYILKPDLFSSSPGAASEPPRGSCNATVTVTHQRQPQASPLNTMGIADRVQRDKGPKPTMKGIRANRRCGPHTDDLQNKPGAGIIGLPYQLNRLVSDTMEDGVVHQQVNCQPERLRVEPDAWRHLRSSEREMHPVSQRGWEQAMPLPQQGIK